MAAELLKQISTAPNGNYSDIERQLAKALESELRTKSIGSATALAIGGFATTLTALSFSLMEWRGVTVTNVYVANFFFIAALGLIITGQWELAVGNGFAFTVFTAFGLFYAGYAAILTPSFGIQQAYGNNQAELANALGFFLIMWGVFVFVFLVASLPTNLIYILIFFTVDMTFIFLAASYFASADGRSSAKALQKTGGVFAFLAGLLGWYMCFHLMLKNSLLEIPVFDTSRYFRKRTLSRRTTAETRTGS